MGSGGRSYASSLSSHLNCVSNPEPESPRLVSIDEVGREKGGEQDEGNYACRYTSDKERTLEMGDREGYKIDTK
jgi:hypothetical protein